MAVKKRVALFIVLFLFQIGPGRVSEQLAARIAYVTELSIVYDLRFVL